VADPVRFDPDEVAQWLEEANGLRRAPWAHWPDPAALAADLSSIDYGYSFVPHSVAVRQVRQVAALLRKAAAAFDGAMPGSETYRSLFCGAAFASASQRITGDESCDPLISMVKALNEDSWNFPSLLRHVADAAEAEIARSPARNTRADLLRFVYGLVAVTLERHTGRPASIRATSPDARFVRDVVEHVGLPWRPRIWRRYGEERAAGRRGEIDAHLVSADFGYFLGRRQTQSVPNGCREKT
jgi:hypothetical protein